MYYLNGKILLALGSSVDPFGCDELLCASEGTFSPELSEFSDCEMSSGADLLLSAIEGLVFSVVQQLVITRIINIVSNVISKVFFSISIFLLSCIFWTFCPEIGLLYRITITIQMLLAE